jgi:hypothetical protein
MPEVEFEPTNPVFEWVRTVHALDRAASVIGPYTVYAALFMILRMKRH